jgi:hypothetical protein
MAVAIRVALIRADIGSIPVLLRVDSSQAPANAAHRCALKTMLHLLGIQAGGCISYQLSISWMTNKPTNLPVE